MTRHKHAQTGLVTPSLPQHWLTATLRMLAMLVHIVASTLQMIRRRDPVNATQAMPSDLPQAKTDTQQQEPNPAAKHRSPIALMVSSTQSVRPSNHEGVLTTPSVSLGSRQAIHLPQCFALMEATQRSVATKGNCLHHSKSGGGGSPRLRGETEGARATHTAAPPPSGGGAKRTARASAKIRWGTALAHLANTCARQSSPARGRTKAAPINLRANKNAPA